MSRRTDQDAGRGDAPIVTFLSPLAVPDFRWTCASVLSASSGRYGVVVVGGDEVFRATHSTVWSSLVMMFLLAPVLVVGPFAGALADRRRRKLIMRGASGLAAAACVVAAIPGPATIDLTVAVAVAMLVGVAQSLYSPSWQALVPAILGPRKLLAGGGFTRMAMQGGEFVGPILATPIVFLLGIKAGFLFCAAAYLAAGALTLKISTPGSPAVIVSPGMTRRIVEGASYIRQNKALAGILTLTGFHCSLTMAFLGMLPALAAGQLDNSSAYGPLVTSLGLGAIGGAFGVALFSARLQSSPVLVGAGLASGAFLVPLALVRSYALALFLAFLASAAQAAFMSASYSVTQTLTPDALRGRVSSVSNMMTAGSMGVLGFAWGAIANVTSVPTVLAALGAAFVIIMVIYLFSFPSLRKRTGLEGQIAIPVVVPDVAM